MNISRNSLMKQTIDSVGLCLGASTIGFVRLQKTPEEIKILEAKTQVHEGNPRQCLTEMFSHANDGVFRRICATGRKFRNYLDLSTIAEPEAIELACYHILPPDHPYRVIISAGGETFMIYHLDQDGRIQSIYSGNKCASGTGEFFLQQLDRMSIGLNEISRIDMPEKFYKVSGRCSVFCKSDCTHALNKGVSKSQVVAGLTHMMAGKILELMKKLPKTGVMLIGGCASNHLMVKHLRAGIPDLYIPAEAPWFEALGASLWAIENDTRPLQNVDRIFFNHGSNFSFLKPLSSFQEKVDFKQNLRGEAKADDRTILGLDVGSTTTKGVIMRRSDKAILAADYLRTEGDPVAASRAVYKSLSEQIKCPITIEGLGVTGSGRQIAGLHAMTDGVINEIVAHATAAVHFDPEVDTIFEIGGQDAKYTYITNGVPSDYAMNEACSAGTGSFLEESAKESLGLDVTEIGRAAIHADCPPNFNDQCAAFIGSDIKGAVQEGISLPNIVAGLVYSICMNYTNRVKGNRPVGNKVFIQGGVCYNEAIPAAMVALTGKEMVVPPDPGLMGAFGVALEVEKRIEQGLLKTKKYDLGALKNREVKYGKPFTCKGGKDCDRGCEVSRIEINAKVYPFGGICNRYDNIIHKRKVNASDLNLVINRERRVFKDLAPDDPSDNRPSIGMNRSLLINTYFPFYNRLFAELGFRLVLPDKIDPEGIKQQGAAFCYPVGLAHGYCADLIAKDPDFFFLPHIRGLDSNGGGTSCTCVFVQGEPFYLRTAFPVFDKKRLITLPPLNFSKDAGDNFAAFEHLIKKLDVNKKEVKSALLSAIDEQKKFHTDIRRMGNDVLSAIDDDPDSLAIVLFGRPYNSFTSIANKGIPEKFASRGVRIIPFDMLPYDDEKLEADLNMYWGMGRMILQGAGYVKKKEKMFGTYITNFSCGPDSFLVGYFRDIMGRKPSLTLELDSHTADAGIETRIEAFLDIARYFRQVKKRSHVYSKSNSFRAAKTTIINGNIGIQSSEKQWLPLHHDRVKVVLPPMGRFGTPLLAKAFASKGIRAEVLPVADEGILKLGRGNSSCKECLPLQTTVGALLHYIKKRPAKEVTAYFMPSTNGPCRFGQYHVFSQKVIAKNKISDAAVISLNSTNNYGGLGNSFTLAAWRAIIIGDLFDEIWATILAAAEDRKKGLEILYREYQAIISVMDKKWSVIAKQLGRSAEELATIPLKKPYNETPKISLIGEIYVRHDPISLQNLVEGMAEQGFIVRTAQNSEWFKYLDWIVMNGIEGESSLGFRVRCLIKKYFDREIRKIFAPSGLFFYQDKVNVEPVLEAGRKFISPNLTGEAILTVGAAMHEILHPSCGVISIGPFGCMPTRIAESVLSEKFTTQEKRGMNAKNGYHQWANILRNDRKFPFLAIETDGNAFPQVIGARLEAFLLQAQRLNDKLLDKPGQPSLYKKPAASHSF
jgi:predicted CoA-substrate-specific enzyme activase